MTSDGEDRDVETSLAKKQNIVIKNPRQCAEEAYTNTNTFKF